MQLFGVLDPVSGDNTHWFNKLHLDGIVTHPSVDVSGCISPGEFHTTVKYLSTGRTFRTWVLVGGL